MLGLDRLTFRLLLGQAADALTFVCFYVFVGASLLQRNGSAIGPCSTPWVWVVSP